jgi:hypothetical protein
VGGALLPKNVTGIFLNTNGVSFLESATTTPFFVGGGVSVSVLVH